MTATFELVAVAFLRRTGGRVGVLFAIDRDGEQLFGGEPALLVEHRPGGPVQDLQVETADGIDGSASALVHASAATELAQLVEEAHDEYGQLDGARLLGRSATFDAAADTFDR